jgi:hypothetical protein
MKECDTVLNSKSQMDREDYIESNDLNVIDYSTETF